MKKFLKNTFILALVAAGGYYLFRKFMQVRELEKLGKSLPEFLKNVIGETPKIKITMIFHALKIKLGLSAETLEKDMDIADIVNEYIEDFYPSLSNCKIQVVCYNKDVDSDDCCCCHDENCDCTEDSEKPHSEQPEEQPEV